MPALRLARRAARGPTSSSTAECLDLVRQLAELGVLEVTLIGGEAYLRDDWLEIVARHPRARACTATMTTGGRGITAERARAAAARRAGERRASRSTASKPRTIGCAA